ncbi:hypothetical protein KAR91_18935 [Candidatus Pacearchaeota archaeon]|nr:hypothetical protein [Candidatus Pacearchaeota archaeon]
MTDQEADAEAVRLALLGKGGCLECEKEFFMAELVDVSINIRIKMYQCIDCYAVPMRPIKRIVRY